MCVLIADASCPAALRHICGTGAVLETNARPPLGSDVELHHPEAGVIRAIVEAVSNSGIALRFDCDESSVAFAMAAITADMSLAAA